jgi:hypothetical protein
MAEEAALLVVKGTLQLKADVERSETIDPESELAVSMSLHHSATSASALWEGAAALDSNRGYFVETMLVTNLPGPDGNGSLWLGLTLDDGTELQPRIRVTDMRATPRGWAEAAHTGADAERTLCSVGQLSVSLSASIRDAGVRGTASFLDHHRADEHPAIDLSRGPGETADARWAPGLQDFGFRPDRMAQHTPDLTPLAPAFAPPEHHYHPIGLGSEPSWRGDASHAVPNHVALTSYELRWNSGPAGARSTGPVWAPHGRPQFRLTADTVRPPDPAKQIMERLLAPTRISLPEIHITPQLSLVPVTRGLAGANHVFGRHAMHHRVGSVSANFDRLAGTRLPRPWNTSALTHAQTRGLNQIPHQHQSRDFTPQPFQFPQVPVNTPQWNMYQPTFQAPQIPTYTPPVFGQ